MRSTRRWPQRRSRAIGSSLARLARGLAPDYLIVLTLVLASRRSGTELGQRGPGRAVMRKAVYFHTGVHTVSVRWPLARGGAGSGKRYGHRIKKQERFERCEKSCDTIIDRVPYDTTRQSLRLCWFELPGATRRGQCCGAACATSARATA